MDNCEIQGNIGIVRIPFNAGDFLFVPAGMKHRFLDFGENLETWVIFYGPEGGECVD